MSVVNINIIKSEEQVVAGIPRFIELECNIPASIFYTLDGSTPTLYSTVYTNKIRLPYNLLEITLSVFASNGVNSSPIIVEKYSSNVTDNVRLPHAGTSGNEINFSNSQFPFASGGVEVNTQFINSANVGITVNNPALPTISSGFDADGLETGFTNQPFDTLNYQIKYSTTDQFGNPGVGTLPAAVAFKLEEEIPETTDQFSNLFDPRALVIFQDFSKEDPNGVAHINKQFFTLENSEKTRSGNNYFSAGLDSPAINGSFVRSHYNPKTNCITYYYLDTWSNRWIISTAPYQPSGTFDGNLAGMVAAGGSAGAKYVYEFLPFRYRTLI